MRHYTSFYVKDELVFDFRTDSPPKTYKKGDLIFIYLNRLYPVTINNFRKKYNDDFIKHCVDKTIDTIDKYGNVELKVVKVYETIEKDFNNMLESNDDNQYMFRTEYQCEFHNTFTWKFWETYKFRKFFK